MINSYQPLKTNCVLIRIIYKEFITKKTYIQKIYQENNQKKRKNQIIFGGMGTKVENAASDEERIMVSLFLVMSTTQVDKLNG